MTTALTSSKPLVGLLGGIAAGKSTVAGLLKEFGFVVLDSDRLAAEAWDDPVCREALKRLVPQGFSGEKGGDKMDRSAVAKALFSKDELRQSVQKIVHPYVAARRDALIRAMQGDPAVKGFVVDSPLLIESNLATYCDHLLFLDVPEAVRLERAKQRGWTAEEYRRREVAQLPLEEKRKVAHYGISNAADITTVREQLLTILPTLLNKRNAKSVS